MADRKFIVFLLENQKYCINLTTVKSIEEVYSLVTLPIAPDFIKGILNLRGNVIPVYDLKKRFNYYSDSESNEKKLLVIQVSDITIAFEVDSVIGIETVSDVDVKEVPSVIINDETKYIDSIVNFDNNIVVSISVNNLLSESEIGSLNDMIDEYSDK